MITFTLSSANQHYVNMGIHTLNCTLTLQELFSTWKGAPKLPPSKSWSLPSPGVTSFCLFALLHTDTLDCPCSLLPHPLPRANVLLQFDLVDTILSCCLMPCTISIWHQNMILLISCTIHISEPPIQLLVVLGEFRSLST